MFLNRLRLKNIRCFDEIELDFSTEGGSPRKWTVLLGENGTGKSTILRSIGLVTSGSDALTELLSRPEHWIRQGARRGLIEADLVAPTGDVSTLILEIDRTKSVAETISRSLESLDHLNVALKRSAANYFVCGYGVSRRMSVRDVRRAKTSGFKDIRAQCIATLFDADALLNPLESWAMDLDYQREGPGLDIIRSALDGFLPGLKFEQINRTAGQVWFSTDDGVIPLQLLSDGYQNVATLMGDLLYRITETFDKDEMPLRSTGLLMIDEIDLHLHPKWQRFLISLLNDKLPNYQLIVTTHSAITAQQAVEDSLHSLKRVGKSVTLQEFEGDPASLLVGQLLMTDAFGLKSDESLRIEEMKARYMALRDGANLSDGHADEMEDLKVRLAKVPVSTRSNAHVHGEAHELIQRITDELSKRGQ